MMGNSKPQVFEDIVKKTSNRKSRDSKLVCRLHCKYELHYELASASV